MTDDAKKIIGLTVTSSTAASLTTLGPTYGYYATVVPPGTYEQIAPPDHPIYALVGRVASTWAHLEHTLDLIIWDLVGIEAERVACVTAQIIGATPRYRTIVSLLKQRKSAAFDKLAKKTEELMQKTYGPTEKRNRIVHDSWYITDKKATAQFRSMPTKDARFGICEVDDNEIKALLEEANKLIKLASDLRVEVLALLAPPRR